MGWPRYDMHEGGECTAEMEYQGVGTASYLIYLLGVRMYSVRWLEYTIRFVCGVAGQTSSNMEVVPVLPGAEAVRY